MEKILEILGELIVECILYFALAAVLVVFLASITAV